MGYYSNPSGSNVQYMYIYVENTGLQYSLKVYVWKTAQFRKTIATPHGNGWGTLGDNSGPGEL